MAEPYRPAYLEGLELSDTDREGFRIADELMALSPERQLRVFWMFTGLHCACEELAADLAECIRNTE